MRLFMLGYRGAMLLGWYKFTYKINVYSILTYFLSKCYEGSGDKVFCDCQEKKANGNIIGARWQDIRHRGEIIAVNRRTGGLEIAM